MNNEFFKRILSSIILIPIAIFFIVKGSYYFNFFLLICFFITIYEWHKMTKKRSYNLIGIIFLLLSFYSIYKIRNDFNLEFFYLLFVTTICVATDVGGYIFGMIFKGPKLTKISPKKTYSGSIGGYFLSVIFVNLLFYLPLGFGQIEFTRNTFFFVICVSTISQLGDISISHFKRLSKIKDTGKIIPGHGGLLDRIDGMIFAFPFSYIIFLNWKF